MCHVFSPHSDPGKEDVIFTVKKLRLREVGARAVFPVWQCDPDLGLLIHHDIPSLTPEHTELTWASYLAVWSF